MQELKIKIKEVIDERRQLTEEQSILLHENDEMFSKRIDTYLNKIGYIENTFDPSDGVYGSSIFRKEIIRDADPDECVAWHKMKSGRCMHSACEERINQILKGKEIILEIE